MKSFSVVNIIKEQRPSYNRIRLVSDQTSQHKETSLIDMGWQFFFQNRQVGIAGMWSSHSLTTLREESSQINVMLQYKLLASTLSVVCSVIQQS